ncbi:hypothetical protein B5F13_00370 [Drancourtella sp. An177]|nr:hypothetical protein B5F13_00370 [Drancourtella sp. An177]
MYMKYLVIDFEMNPLDREHITEKEICGDEIIQIGAVALDEKYAEISHFMIQVKPQMNTKIERRIEKLTGITTQMLDKAPYFEEALETFFVWCDSLQDRLQIIQWSDSDREQFCKELLLKRINLTKHQEEMISGWYDFQKEYGEKLGLERLVSLKDALMYAGIDAVGRQHDALYDAQNTAVLFKTVRIPDLYKKALGKVVNALQTKSVSTSLGDMFDFSQLELTA